MYSNPQFIDTYVKTDEFEGQLTIEDLTAGHSYSLYCYAYNLNAVKSEFHRRLDFTLRSDLISATEDSNIYSRDKPKRGVSVAARGIYKTHSGSFKRAKREAFRAPTVSRQ